MMNTNRILTLAILLLAVTFTAASAQNTMPVAPGSLDDILTQVAAYEGGISSDALWKLREYVYSRRDDTAGRAACEAKLLQFLKGPATRSAKMAATRLLREIAGDTAIPALQVMAADPRFSDYAIYVLQPMPGSAAENALVGALTAARGAQKAAIVAALGQRRASSALPLLEPMLRDPALAPTAAVASGRIGGPAASAALASAYGAAPAESRRVLAASLLEAGDGLLAEKDSEAAGKLFGTLAADRSLPAPMRTAAFIGNLSAAGPRASTVLVTMLGGDDADARAAAIARIGDVIPPEGIGPVCDLLPRLPEADQVKVLAALSRYPAARVKPVALAAAKSDSTDVRVAALRTLESVGDASTVAYLADTAGSAPKGLEQDAARRTLGSLKGREVDDAIVTLLGQPAPAALTAELLKAVADRRIFLAKPAVSAMLAAPSAVVRVEAMKTLRTIGTPSDASPVLDVLVKTADETEQAEAEKTVAALLQKGSPENRSRPVRMRLMAEKDPAIRAKLIGLLAPTGDGAALPVLRTALGDADAGVAEAATRGIAAWPTATARDDMLKIVRESKDETHRLLAFGGLVRLVSADAYRMPEAAVADLQVLSGLAWRPEEQKLVLGAVASFPCQAALDFANGFVNDDALKAEAKAAVDKITQGMRRPGRR